MTVHLRPARREDQALLVAFNQSLARDSEDTSLDPMRIGPGVEAVLADAAKGEYRVAEVDGVPVGCLMVTREWSDWRNGWIWWIQSVYVDGSARRKGVYRALHDDVLARARAAGDVCGVRLYVEQENSGAQAVYAACGMAPSRYRLFSQDVQPGDHA